MPLASIGLAGRVGGRDVRHDRRLVAVDDDVLRDVLELVYALPIPAIIGRSAAEPLDVPGQLLVHDHVVGEQVAPGVPIAGVHEA